MQNRLHESHDSPWRSPPHHRYELDRVDINNPLRPLYRFCSSVMTTVNAHHVVIQSHVRERKGLPDSKW